ncbi:hypothetical protein [Methylobacterium aquaticum]|uniref:Zinc finger SWIM domain-containing protein n=1 Tax=Methylobacterium aquaticum TaxID=270351 RepID=A0A0J6STC1_9HYPH|nr:hypothetical protein [Methylobacterium aquaticum]KMO36964.1 zinc finger SWIM domain-containing protein [Methylobacterium aquaticum]
MARPDLLALTEDGLIQLANAGLVKRALREVAAGQGPALTEGPDGIVEARFPDGTVTRLSPGRPPGEAACTCPASGLCRHRVALVVAYRAEAVSSASQVKAPEAAPSPTWNPGTLDGATFEAGLGTSAAAELKRLLGAGVTVGLDYGPVPSARLPTASVRFLVPDAVHYARCDCAAGGGCAHVAVAIRAFREAAGAAEVRLGGTDVAAAEDLAAAVDRLVEGLLDAGTAAGPEAHGAALDGLRRAAQARGATQILLAEAELRAQLAAYAARSATYDEGAVLALATELMARTRAADPAALGLGQPYETAMAKTRLVSLGARIVARGRGAVARVALADTDTGATLALEREFEASTDEPGFVAALPGRPLAPGLTLAGIGRGQILTSVARRRADGLLVLGQGARGRTALLPRDAVLRLPAPLAVSEVRTVLHRLTDRAPGFLRPRDRLDALHLFDVGEILGQAWSPGAQLWQAAVDLPGDGGRLHLARSYDRAAPGALGILAAAFAGAYGAVRQVAGRVRIEAGTLLCEPWSVGTERLVVPDLDDPDRPGAPLLPVPAAGERDAIEETEALLAGALHAGRRAFAPVAAASGPRLVARLRQTGHAATAMRLSAFLASREGTASIFAQAALWIAVMREDAGPLDTVA